MVDTKTQSGEYAINSEYRFTITNLIQKLHKYIQGNKCVYIDHGRKVFTIRLN